MATTTTQQGLFEPVVDSPAPEQSPVVTRPVSPSGPLAEVVAAHPDREDLLSTPSAMNQLACHLVGAPEKESWNLETDRPDKGLVGFMVDKCN